MSDPDTLLARNRNFARTYDKGALPPPVLPNCRAFVITCVDPRVEPGAVLGVGLADAIVARSAGGRVTKNVARDVAWICHLKQLAVPDADWFEIIVMHHTECGAALLADDGIRADFHAKVGGSDGDLLALAVVDPEQTVAHDVDALLDAPGIPPEVSVSGWIYDLNTGVAEQFIAPRSRAIADPTGTAR